MKCHKCGASFMAGPVSCPFCGVAVLSDPDASLDRLVQGASVPSLSTLFRRAKAKGAIAPVSVYGEGKPS